MHFSTEQLQRYSRHIVLPEVGEEGQIKLARARVFIIGVGGLGCPVGYYLAAAGVGTIGLIDNDVVEISNLQRQIAHSMASVGMLKVESAKKTFECLNPDVAVISVPERLTEENIVHHFSSYDVIVDCSDNFATRFLVNDACVLMRKPLVSGAILKFEGQVMTILPGKGHCYRCLFEDLPPQEIRHSLQTSGLLGTVPGVIGPIQAMEVLKYLLGIGKLLSDRLLTYDAINSRFRTVRVPPNPACRVCGDTKNR